MKMIDINPNELETELIEREIKMMNKYEGKCAECIYWHEGLSVYDGFCDQHKIYMTGSDFCSRGDKR